MHENKEELKKNLKELLREKSDVYSSENPDEDKVWSLRCFLIGSIHLFPCSFGSFARNNNWMNER